MPLHPLKLIRYALPVFAVALTAITAAAQTATPVPTAAPTAVVAIVIDTNAIFSSANSWIVSFTPIFAIGIGIAIAITILGFIGTKIVAAFRGGSK